MSALAPEEVAKVPTWSKWGTPRMCNGKAKSPYESETQRGSSVGLARRQSARGCDVITF